MRRTKPIAGLTNLDIRNYYVLKRLKRLERQMNEVILMTEKTNQQWQATPVDDSKSMALGYLLLGATCHSCAQFQFCVSCKNLDDLYVCELFIRSNTYTKETV